MKNLLTEWKCDVVCLQETKLDSIISAGVMNLWGSPFVEWVALDANHTARDVLLIWDRRMFEKVDCVVGRFSVSMLLKGVTDGFEWVCSEVYRPTNVSLRDALWAEHDTVRLRWSLAWSLFSDFNAIKYPVERFGCTSFSSNMFKFLDFFEKHFLVDLPLIGGDFTWFCGSNNPSMSRIDKVLVSTEWKDHFLDVTQRLLPRVLLDHCPLLVEVGGMLKGKSLFKFENM